MQAHNTITRDANQGTQPYYPIKNFFIINLYIAPIRPPYTIKDTRGIARVDRDRV